MSRHRRGLGGDQHSVLCRTERDVAYRHDQELLMMMMGVAIGFVEDHPKNIAFYREGEPHTKEVHFCKYCFYAQVQFEPPRHADHCIVRQFRAAMKKCHEHIQWHDYSHDNDWFNYYWPIARKIRWGFRWLESYPITNKKLPKAPKGWHPEYMPYGV
jgi:hypothetical protein